MFILTIIIFSFFLKVKLTKAINCNLNSEIYVDNYCYKLLPLKYILLLKHNECFSKDSIFTECIDFYENVLSNLINLYLNNQLVFDKYEFTILKTPNKDPTKWKRLINVYSKESKIKNFKIFMNVYTKNNDLYYIKNHVIDNLRPSIKINGNYSDCIFGKIEENVSTIKFYYEKCDRLNSFMCIKPYKINDIMRKNSSIFDCSAFNKSPPGGNWYYCTNFTFLFNNTFRTTVSQKCCMYNANLLKTYTDAVKFCSKFDSYLFSLNLHDFKSIDLNYVDYLNRNYNLDDKEKYFKFWISLNRDESSKIAMKKQGIFNQKNQFYLDLGKHFEDDQKVCSNFDSHLFSINLAESFKSSYKNSSVFNVVFVNFDYKFNYTVSCLNLIYLYKTIFDLKRNLFNKTSQIEESIGRILKSLINSNETVFLFRRLSSDANLRKTNQNECYSYRQDENKTINYISIPFINNCYHFRLSQFNHTSRILKLNSTKEFDELVDNMMNIFDLKPVRIHSLTNKSVLFVALLQNETYTMHNLTLKNLNFNQKSVHWLDEFKNIISSFNGYSLILQNITQINYQLELTCFDTFETAKFLIQDCFKKDYSNRCFFKCPNKCENNDGIVWQNKSPFSYLSSSNICLAARHFGIHTGCFSFNSSVENKKNTKIDIYRNDVSTNMWPLDSISNLNFLYQEMELFNFESNSNNQTFSIDQIEESISKSEIYLLIKPINIIVDNPIINFYVYKNKDEKFSFEFQEIYPPKSYFNFSLPFQIEYTEKNDFYKFTTSIQDFSLINRYYKLKVKNHDNSIKFPINFAAENFLSLPNAHIIKIDLENSSSTENLELYSKKTVKRSCYWYLMDLNTNISCVNSLNFSSKNHQNYNNFVKQNFIFYPNNEFKLFTRINFYKKNLKCRHNGIFLKNSNNCLCLPGFRGDNCEFICDKPFEFGEKCQFKCLNSNCSGYLACGLEQIGCSCLSGYTGYNCTEKCVENDHKWGPNCQFQCKNCSNTNSSCDIHTGKCVCKNEFIKGARCDECIAGYYGNDCKFKCPTEYCLNCNKSTGNCNRCENKFECFDQKCTKCKISCPSHCSNFSCTEIRRDFCTKKCSTFHEECGILCENSICQATRTTERIHQSNSISTIISTTTRISYNFSTSCVNLTKIEIVQTIDTNIFYYKIWLIVLLAVLTLLFSLNVFDQRKRHMKSIVNYKNVNLKLNSKIPKNNEILFNFQGKN